MRVLIVSHTVLSDNESMGKTLSSYFCEFNTDDLAQFYIHSQVPTSSLCKRYYRMTDKDAILSILGFRKGITFGNEEIESNRSDSRVDQGVTAAIYQKGRKRTPTIYILRNLWWRLSRWNNKKFKKWLDDFNPECVFFASGDYSFMYRIAYKIAKERNIPLYISCMDDYYYHNKNDKSILGRIQYNYFIRIVNEVIDYSQGLFCICDKMSLDYQKSFNKPCYTLHTSSTINMPLKEEKKKKISYIGNLGYKRVDQLVSIGKVLKSIGIEPSYIDVYSAEQRNEIISKLSTDNGIMFHGSVNADTVLKIMGESLAVIHTESFDEVTRKSVKYSISTKIADSLASGTCIFAYGPEEIASISYLNNNNAAICCTRYSDLEGKIKELLINESLRNAVIKNALELAVNNHASNKASNTIKAVIEKN